MTPANLLVPHNQVGSNATLTRRDLLRTTAGLGLAACLGGSAAAATSNAPAREDVAGWIILRLAGKPREIGQQHGSLAAVEIDDALKAMKHEMGPTGEDAWKKLSTTAKRLFWEKLEPEYREEIEGIAEGLKEKGFQYTADDILAFNAHIEVSGYYMPSVQNRLTGRRVSGAPMACSAFVSTGGATTDGKVVMGHNLWWDYVMGARWKVILDVRPEKGLRFMMDALPGFIHSGSDFAINSAGITLCETTIGGFMGFDTKGLPEFMRMRKAMQYSENLDDLYRNLQTGNNGGYANAWLAADTRKGEIGKIELGLKNVIFHRTTDGAYYGANYPEDPKLAAEECEPGVAQRSASRRARWAALFKQNRGKVNLGMAKSFLGDTVDGVNGRSGATASTLCGRSDLDPQTGYSLSGAVNNKVVTADQAAAMQFSAKMGFADGSAFKVDEHLKRDPGAKRHLPYLKDIDINPWITIENRSVG